MWRVRYLGKDNASPYVVEAQRKIWWFKFWEFQGKFATLPDAEGHIKEHAAQTNYRYYDGTGAVLA